MVDCRRGEFTLTKCDRIILQSVGFPILTENLVKGIYPDSCPTN